MFKVFSNSFQHHLYFERLFAKKWQLPMLNSLSTSQQNNQTHTKSDSNVSVKVRELIKLIAASHLDLETKADLAAVSEIFEQIKKNLTIHF
jgi:hypothetical protein